MKQGKRMRSQYGLQISRRPATARTSLRERSAQMWTDIGWIFGLRRDRVKQGQAAQRSSRRRVVLGRVGCGDGLRAEDCSHPAETILAARTHSTNLRLELSSAQVGLAELALDLRDELSYQQAGFLGAAQAIVDPRVRVLGQQLAEGQRPYWLT